MYGFTPMQLVAVAVAIGLVGLVALVGYAMIVGEAEYDRLVRTLTATLGRPPTLEEVRAYGHEVPAAVLRSQR